MCLTTVKSGRDFQLGSTMALVRCPIAAALPSFDTGCLRANCTGSSTCPASGVPRVQTINKDGKLRQNVVRAGKCPFGFESPVRREAKGSALTEAASAATKSPPSSLTTPYAPAPSSSPDARNLGPGTYEYLPMKVPYKMTMGLKPLDPKEWIEIDIFYEEEMALRRKVLETRKEVAIATHPEYYEAAIEANWELLEELVKFLPKRFPKRFVAEKGGRVIHNLSTGESFDISDKSLDPLDVSSRLVQEDLCIMMEVDGVVRFVSGAVLFPQRWQLLEKLGMDMRSIHMPVPLYEEVIGPSVNTFMNHLKPEKPVWRSNWAIADDPTLFQPMTEEDIYAALDGRVRDHDVPITLETAGTRLFTRCERETLIRLPRTQAILFTIRTYIKPLKVFESRPQVAAQLAKALEALPDSISKYKTMAGFYHLALQYLQKCGRLVD